MFRVSRIVAPRSVSLCAGKPRRRADGRTHGRTEAAPDELFLHKLIAGGWHESMITAMILIIHRYTKATGRRTDTRTYEGRAGRAVSSQINRGRLACNCNENNNDNNIGHIDACILVCICVVVSAVLTDVVFKKFGNPGLSFLILRNSRP